MHLCSTFNKRKQQQKHTFVWDLCGLKFKRNTQKEKHNAELQRTAPDTQDKEAFSTWGRLSFFL